MNLSKRTPRVRSSRLFTAALFGVLLALTMGALPPAPAFATTYSAPPYDGYHLTTNNNGKVSGYSQNSHFTTTNEYLCPRAPKSGEGAGEIMEYKYKSFYVGTAGTVTVSATLTVNNGYLDSAVGSNNLADIVVTLGIFDSTGSYVTGWTIWTNTVQNGQSWHGSTNNVVYSGSHSYFQSPGYQTFTLRWTVDVYAQGTALSDFYWPYWLTLTSVTITVPPGFAP